MSNNSNWECGNCGIVYSENPDECESCGSTVLRPTSDEPTDFNDVSEVEISEDILMGRNVEDEADRSILIMEGGYELEVNHSSDEVEGWLRQSCEEEITNLYEFETDSGEIKLKHEKIHGVKEVQCR